MSSKAILVGFLTASTLVATATESSGNGIQISFYEYKVTAKSFKNGNDEANAFSILLKNVKLTDLNVTEMKDLNSRLPAGTIPFTRAVQEKNGVLVTYGSPQNKILLKDGSL
jgi:hypothetical protein